MLSDAAVRPAIAGFLHGSLGDGDLDGGDAAALEDVDAKGFDGLVSDEGRELLSRRVHLFERREARRLEDLARRSVRGAPDVASPGLVCPRRS